MILFLSRRVCSVCKFAWELQSRQRRFFAVIHCCGELRTPYSVLRIGAERNSRFFFSHVVIDKRVVGISCDFLIEKITASRYVYGILRSP